MINGILDSKQKIISDGLVLNYDVSQFRSYPTTGTSLIDLSGNNYTSSLINGPSFSSGNGGSIYFDGVNDYASIINPTSIASQNLTISLWIYPLPAPYYLTTLIDFDHATPGTAQGWVIQSEDAVSNRYYYLAYYSSSTYQPSTGIGAGKGIQITNNTWQNLVFTKNGVNIIGYKNGTQVFTSTASSDVITYKPNKNIKIASVIYSGDAYLRWAKGNISQAQIYNKALTATEVLQNFNANKLRYGL